MVEFAARQAATGTGATPIDRWIVTCRGAAGRLNVQRNAEIARAGRVCGGGYSRTPGPQRWRGPSCWRHCLPPSGGDLIGSRVGGTGSAGRSREEGSALLLAVAEEARGHTSRTRPPWTRRSVGAPTMALRKRKGIERLSRAPEPHDAMFTRRVARRGARRKGHVHVRNEYVHGPRPNREPCVGEHPDLSDADIGVYFRCGGTS